MIKSLNISGFKSFLDNNIEFSNLTLLTGLNSSGKSSIIQSLLMLEKCYNGEKNILINNHGNIKELKNPYQKGAIEFIVADADNNESKITLSDDEYSAYNYTMEGDNISFPEIIYISANRFGPKNIIPIFNNNFQRNKVGINGENLLQFIKVYENELLDTSLIHPKSEGQTLLFNLRGWLNIISPNVKFSYNIDEKSDTSYALFNDYRSYNVGYGLSYSLAVIASLLISTLIPNCLLIIENPEAHLHPKGQTELAGLICKCAKLGTQIIIETHSDHIFDGVRIACKTIPEFHDQVSLNWFELNEYLNTQIISPKIDATGKLDEWPKGLFDQFDINSTLLF
jgi:predicted ATPase